MNDLSPTHLELMRLLARRGELTRALELNDLDIARYQGMFDLERAINAAPAPQPAQPTPAPAAGGQSDGDHSRSREAPDSTSGAPTEVLDDSAFELEQKRRERELANALGGSTHGA